MRQTMKTIGGWIMNFEIERDRAVFYLPRGEASKRFKRSHGGRKATSDAELADYAKDVILRSWKITGISREISQPTATAGEIEVNGSRLHIVFI